MTGTGLPTTSDNSVGSPKGQLVRHADLSPGYLFGAHHASLKYGHELDGAVRVDRSGYKDGVITKEIRRYEIGMLSGARRFVFAIERCWCNYAVDGISIFTIHA